MLYVVEIKKKLFDTALYLSDVNSCKMTSDIEEAVLFRKETYASAIADTLNIRMGDVNVVKINMVISKEIQFNKPNMPEVTCVCIEPKNHKKKIQRHINNGSGKPLCHEKITHLRQYLNVEGDPDCILCIKKYGKNNERKCALTEQEYLLTNAENDLKQALKHIENARVRALNAKSISVKHTDDLVNSYNKITSVLNTLSNKIKFQKESEKKTENSEVKL